MYVISDQQCVMCTKLLMNMCEIHSVKVDISGRKVIKSLKIKYIRSVGQLIK